MGVVVVFALWFLVHCWLCYYRFSYYVSLGLVFCFSWFFTFFSVLTKRLAGKSIPKMTCFVLSGKLLSINSVNQASTTPHQIQKTDKNTEVSLSKW